MNKVAKGGKTVIFVSHDMRAISDLCDRVLLLEEGSIKRSGPPLEIIEKYLSTESSISSSWVSPEPDKVNGDVKLVSAEILSPDCQPIEIVSYNSGFNVKITYNVHQLIKDLVIYLRISDPVGNDIWTSWDTDLSQWNTNLRYPGTYNSICKVPPFIMRPGRYRMQFGAMVPGVRRIENQPNAIILDITDIGYPFNKQRIGIITPVLEWEIEQNGMSGAENAN